METRDVTLAALIFTYAHTISPNTIYITEKNRAYSNLRRNLLSMVVVAVSSH